MEVIPAINCGDEGCVRKHLEMLKDIPAKWVHFDVSDGKFTPAKTWDVEVRLPGEVGLRKVEVHLMVEKPEEYAPRWVAAGAKRVLAHVEIVESFKLKVESFTECEFGLALLPETPVETVYPYLDKVRFVQFLAVSPGFSGQKFQENILDKIRALRERDISVIIEVDGGTNDAVASLARRAGANVIVSSSYIWNNPRPAEAFASLRRAQ
ncbi:MAG: hypothetical protein Q8R20_01915 [Nanoarchaeota archaeon]|nr:hypothetical protein [Nanoarchaeota archaeon]